MFLLEGCGFGPLNECADTCCRVQEVRASLPVKLINNAKRGDFN
jgi:hypothetical protein